MQLWSTHSPGGRRLWAWALVRAGGRRFESVEFTEPDGETVVDRPDEVTFQELLGCWQVPKSAVESGSGDGG